MTMPNYPLHRLGWQAFQDLCVAIVEERVEQAVQTFLPTNDSGRDGAFRGRWESTQLGQSTLQCKFTSSERKNLTLSMLTDELPKAKRLAQIGLADDYIILTNHVVTGASELRIRLAFEAEGVKCCRVFHHDWIVSQICESPRLRMMVPRLYGIVDLAVVLDSRAYKQAQLILSEMGEGLQRLVVTEAHRKSVKAISEHNLVLLLGSPAAGKSTIGASLALGAGDIWNALTIKSTSPDHLEAHIDPDGGQFFWIDDAWGSTQFQRERTEKWNQVFPLMQGAMRRGTRFLITSRDYIWAQAREELKLSALPALSKSQVIINVQELSVSEKARILYNHLKLGDQDPKFLKAIRPFLPMVARCEGFLPESARRLGSKFFTGNLGINNDALEDFFKRPKEFLELTISNLSREGRATIALVFLNGGHVRSPVLSSDLEIPSTAFGVQQADIRAHLQVLRGSLLNLVQDENGHYWTYHHPTVSDAFASYVAKNPELIEIYLRGAKPESIVQEVVCPGAPVSGAAVVVPNSMHQLLAEKISGLPSYSLRSFVSYRSNRNFSEKLIALRPNLVESIPPFIFPIEEDSDMDFFVQLQKQGVLPEQCREKLVGLIHQSVVETADASFLSEEGVGLLLTQDEHEEFKLTALENVLERIDEHVERVKNDWVSDYDPNSHFEELRASLDRLTAVLETDGSSATKKYEIKMAIENAIRGMIDDYSEPEPVTAPAQQSASTEDSLFELFRDVHE